MAYLDRELDQSFNAQQMAKRAPVSPQVPQQAGGDYGPSVVNPELMSTEDFNVYLGSLMNEGAPKGQAPIQYVPETQTTYKEIPGIADLQKQQKDLDTSSVKAATEQLELDSLKSQQIAAQNAQQALDLENETLRIQQEKNKAIMKAEEDVKAAEAAIKEFKIDPNRLMASNTMNQIWASLAVGIAYAANENMGRATSEKIDRLINNDIKAQEQELQKLKDNRTYKENMITALYKKFGDEQAAVDLAQSLARKTLAARLEYEAYQNGSNKLKNSIIINDLKTKAVDKQLEYAEKQAKVVTTKLTPMSSTAAQKDIWDVEERLRKEITKDNPAFQKYISQQEAAAHIAGISPKNAVKSGPTQIQLLFDYLKALDPLSVVRESEIALFGTSKTIGDWINSKIQAYTGAPDVLTENQIKQMQEVINRRLAESYITNIMPLRNQYRRIVEDGNLNPNHIFLMPPIPSNLKKQAVGTK